MAGIADGIAPAKKDALKGDGLCPSALPLRQAQFESPCAGHAPTGLCLRGLPADEPFDEDGLYRAMDQMNGQWVGMEKGLYQQSFPARVTVAL